MLLLKKVKISEVSEFSILSYTQNQKLGNLGKCPFSSNFDSICNLRFRSNENELRQKLKGQDMLFRRKNFFSRFPSFWFCPIPKIENLEISESVLLLQFLTVFVTFSEFAFSANRVKPWFFETFNIKSHLSWKFHYSFSRCSEDIQIFSFNINIFIIFLGFLTFPC